MKFNDYQIEQMKTCNPKTTNDERIVNAALGLGEAGEVQNLVKKWKFQGHPLAKDKIVDELGDILWYISLMAYTLGLDLSVIANYNVEKLRKRYPNGFEEAKSINRKD
jgi:NTP pyrophosphatase (non-canonical NTP hydrolase)